MKRWILFCVVLGMTSGCDRWTFNEQKAEAHKRWFNTRARVLYRLAKNHFSGGRLDSAEEAVRQAITLQPDYRDAKLLLAKIEIEQGRYTPAIERLESISDGQKPSAEVAYLLGVAQEKTGTLAEALDSYRRAHALNESDLAPVKASAEVLVAMGNVRRAQLQIESYLPKAGEDPGMYELAGRLAMMNKEYDKAVTRYLRARDLDPENLRYMEALARAEYAAGRCAEAAETLKELLARKEYTPGAWVHMMLGDACLAGNKARQAFEAYFTASELAPDEPAVWSSLARSALAMNDPGRAVLAAKQALLLQPEELEVTLLLGYALIRQGRPAEAVEAFTAATKAHPDSSMARCLLGRAHAAAGNAAEAVRCYTAALKLDPKNTLARELLALAGAEQISSADGAPRN